MEKQRPHEQSRLRYAAGWSEILHAPDAVDYQMWLEQMSDFTQQQLREVNDPWAEDREEIHLRWQRAVELVAGMTMTPEDIRESTEAAIVETALITLQENIDGVGWYDEGLVFEVPNMYAVDESEQSSADIIIDLRDMDTLYPYYEISQWLIPNPPN